jgi:peptidoglycan/xylan/chitin deacetylase (PgdA/CDA1 family)
MNFASSGHYNLPIRSADLQLTTHPKINPSAELDNQLRTGVPILMYHRVATDGPLGLERFRVDPTLFGEQLSALKQAGFRTVGLDDWVGALSRSEALCGKPIILTFDDGYRDFLTAALPALRRYSLAATVFLVANRIGGLADWDLSYGEAAPLMSWHELREIGKEEVVLGCHSLSHQPMTQMNPADLVTDARRARELLELGLEHSVTHFAYPYGAENSFVRNVVGDLGFVSAVSCRSGLSRLGNDLMSLPRIEVTGSCTPEDLIIRLDS